MRPCVAMVYSGINNDRRFSDITAAHNGYRKANMTHNI